MPKLDDDIDALFKLPLTEFVGARKALAARLKQNGFVSEAEGVKALAKPSISAWTVNQLYWRHREAFDELIATGQRFRKAQVTGKMVNMREALDARREALSRLSDLATEALRDAGHNPSLDTLRRIATTLEALSVATSLSDRPTLGRLTHDIDPPGFDSLAASQEIAHCCSCRGQEFGGRAEKGRSNSEGSRAEQARGRGALQKSERRIRGCNPARAKHRRRINQSN